MDVGQLLKESWDLFIADIVNLILFCLVGALLCITVIMIPVSIAGMVIGILGYVKDGRKPEFSDLWSHWDKFLPVLLMMIVMGILVMIGFMLLIVPGIFLMTVWMYALFFLVDNNMGFWEAMESSRKAVMEKGFGINFVILLLGTVINSIGSAVGGVGSILTAPFVLVFLACAYMEVAGAGTKMAGVE